jgi:hypothetical protein
VLRRPACPGAGAPAHHSQIEPYLPFIHATLEKFPDADRLPPGRYGARARLPRLTRSLPLVACHWPGRPEAYLRLRSLPGEQVHWGQFGLTIGRARRPLTAFVMVLSHSRPDLPAFFLDARMESFLRGHVAAFEAWNGCARVLLYDNLKSAVLERHGDAIRFHPTLIAFAAHYRYEARPVAVARGNEKGRPERAIRPVRDSFFAARSFTDLDDLNSQAAAWCSGAADRPAISRAARAERARSLRGPRRRACCLCRTIHIRCSSASPSRSARHPMSASISTTTRCRIQRCSAC